MNDMVQKQQNQSRMSDEDMWTYIAQSTGMTKRQYKQHLKTMTKKLEKRNKL
jgi:hypothetical protein